MAPYPASSKANWAGRDRSCSPRNTTRSHYFQPKSWPPGDRAAPRLDTHTQTTTMEGVRSPPPQGPPARLSNWSPPTANRRSWLAELAPTREIVSFFPILRPLTIPATSKGGCPRSGRSNCLRGALQRPERRQQRKESGARGGISWPCKGSPPASQPAIQWTTGSAEALIMSPRLCSVCGRTPTSLPGTGHANQACRAVQHRGPIHAVWSSVSLSLPQCRGEAQAIGPPMDRCRHFSLGGPWSDAAGTESIKEKQPPRTQRLPKQACNGHDVGNSR